MKNPVPTKTGTFVQAEDEDEDLLWICATCHHVTHGDEIGAVENCNEDECDETNYVRLYVEVTK